MRQQTGQHCCIKSIYNGFASYRLHLKSCAVWGLFCSSHAFYLQSPFGYLGEITKKISLQQLAAFFLKIYAYLRLIYIRHSHQALNMQCQGQFGCVKKQKYDVKEAL